MGRVENALSKARRQYLPVHHLRKIPDKLHSTPIISVGVTNPLRGFSELAQSVFRFW